MPGAAQIGRTLDDLAVDEPGIAQMARLFYRIKAAAYREQLLELAHRYGLDHRKRVNLSAEIRDALERESRAHAELVARSLNKAVHDRAAKLIDQGFGQDTIDVALRGYLRQRIRNRSHLITEAEQATAKLDAQVQFYRENGVEPLFDLKGGVHKNTCELCKGLISGGPWPIEKVILIGHPHMNCRHNWVARGVRREDLIAAGARPHISTARTGVAGIVGGDRPYGHRFPTAEAALRALEGFMDLSDSEIEIFAASTYEESEHPRDELGRWAEKQAAGKGERPKADPPRLKRAEHGSGVTLVPLRPQYQRWLDKARVDLPDVQIEIRDERCPSPATALACTAPDGVIYIDPSIAKHYRRNALFHELGHQWAYQFIEGNPDREAAMLAAMGLQGPWRQPALLHQSPNEVFAEIYKQIALQATRPGGTFRPPTGELVVTGQTRSTITAVMRLIEEWAAAGVTV